MQIIKIALEKYKISHDNKNYVILKNKNSGKVLSINGGMAKNSANIEQWDYKDEKSQKWIAVKQTNGRIVFLSTLDADYCIDLQSAIAANESNIQLYSKNDTLAQQWKAVKYNPIQELADQNRGAISDGEYRIKSALNEKYIIDVRWASKDNGANIHWGRGWMAFCVSLVEFKVSAFKENKSGSLSTREPFFVSCRG